MAMKRSLRMSVVITVIACGVLYGQRALESSAPMAVAAAGLSQFTDPDPGSGGADGNSIGGSWLEIGPVAGLTTAWHQSPDQSSIPLGSTVQFRVVVAPGIRLTWIGATEEHRDEHGSVASSAFNKIGRHAVRAEVMDPQDGPMLLESVFDVVATSAADVTITPPEVSVEPVVIDETLPEDELNQLTMNYYFGESIAALRDLGNGRYRTSSGRLVHMSAQADPPGFNPLIEWRLDGEVRVLGGSHSEVFDAETPDLGGSDSGVSGSNANVHNISVGPTDNPAEFEIEIYRVVITGQVPEGDIIPEGVPVTFTAVTAPPGYEEDITWLPTTKYGTGVPVLGSGPTFTTQFDDTWGPHPDGGLFQWLGVKGDNATAGQDQKSDGDQDAIGGCPDNPDCTPNTDSSGFCGLCIRFWIPFVGIAGKVDWGNCTQAFLNDHMHILPEDATPEVPATAGNVEEVDAIYFKNIRTAAGGPVHARPVLKITDQCTVTVTCTAPDIIDLEQCCNCAGTVANGGVVSHWTTTAAEGWNANDW